MHLKLLSVILCRIIYNFWIDLLFLAHMTCKPSDILICSEMEAKPKVMGLRVQKINTKREEQWD